MLKLSPLVHTVHRTLSALGVSENDRIGVAVSGGADSMVLLAILHALGLRVQAYHVNHRLRGEASDQDAAFVQAWCASREIDCHIREADTLAHKITEKLSVQESARDIRYAWWTDLHRAGRFEYLATGHHLDDNIETVFMRLLRGTGFHGLQGIPPRRGFIIRPLLDAEAAEIRAFAQEHGIPWREDSSNRKDTYLRNRIRNTLLPLVDELVPAYRSGLRRSIGRMRAEAAAWSAMSPVTAVEKDDDWQIDCPRQGVPWLCAWLEERDIPWPLSYDFLMGGEGQRHSALNYGEWTLARTGLDQYILFKAVDRPGLEIPAPGTYVTGDMVLQIDRLLRPASLVVPPGEMTAYMSPPAVAWPLDARPARNGDRIRPFGMAGHTKKLQDLFTDEKVPVHARRNSIVLADGREVLWVPGLRLSEVVKVRPEDDEVLRFRLTQKT